MSVLALNRFACIFDIVNKNSGYFISDLNVTNDETKKNSPEQVIDRLMQELQTLLSLDTITQKPQLKELKQRARTYFKGKLKKSTPKMCILFLSLFPLAKARWKHDKSMAKKIIADDNSINGFKILKGKESIATYGDLNTLCYPRDMVFLVQELQNYINKLCLLQLEICKRLSSGNKIVPMNGSDEDEPYPAAVCFEYPETELYTEVKKVSLQLVENRIVKSDKVARVVEPLLRKLVGSENCDNYIKVLELNELIAQREDLIDDWGKYIFAAHAYAYDEFSRAQFVSLSYKPRRQLAFLARVGKSLTDYLQRTLETQASVDDQQRVCQHTYNLLKRFEQAPQVDTYKNLTRALNKLIQRFLSDRDDIAQDYKEIVVTSTEVEASHPEYEVYKWVDISTLAYTEGTFKELGELAVTQTLKKVRIPPKPVSADRGYGIVVHHKPRKSCLPKKKQPKAEPEPVARTTTVAYEIEKIIVSLAKVTISPLPIVAIPKPEPVITAKAKLKYDKSVIRWNPNWLAKEDPINVDPAYHHKKYNARDRLWIHLKHNFARVVDDFIHFGVYERDPKKLEQLKATRRLQLVADITITTQRRKDRKTGVITYTEGHGGLWFHRYFTIKGKSEELIDPAYAEKGWALLKNPPVAKEQENPNLLAKDLSFVEYQSKDLVIINDPKNRARIRLVPYKP